MPQNGRVIKMGSYVRVNMHKFHIKYFKQSIKYNMICRYQILYTYISDYTINEVVSSKYGTHKATSPTQTQSESSISVTAKGLFDYVIKIRLI